MADDFDVTDGVGTIIRAVEKSGKKTPSFVLDLGGAGAENLLTDALPVRIVLVAADADITQLITVTTAGTPAQGPNKANPGGWMLKASADNTDTVYFMFHGQTKAARGFPLDKGESMIVPVSNLSSLDFDADVNGEKIHAAKM
jgi:hypothetical protein